MSRRRRTHMPAGTVTPVEAETAFGAQEAQRSCNPGREAPPRPSGMRWLCGPATVTLTLAAIGESRDRRDAVLGLGGSLIVDLPGLAAPGAECVACGSVMHVRHGL